MEPLVLTFDIGTQSTRAILAKKDGSFLDIKQYRYEEPYISEHPFWAEQKPYFYYKAVCCVSKEILEANPDAVEAIKCVTVTTIRDTVICLDKNNDPLGNYIVWLDKREARFDPKEVPILPRTLFQLAGKTDTVEYQVRDSKCNWLMQNDKERWAKTASYVYLSGHLNYLMTGVLADSIGSVIGHMPFDYKKRKWMSKSGLTYCVYPIPQEKLFPVVEPGEEIGRISAKCSEETGIPAGLPLIATGSDKGCETVGLSVTKLGTAAVSFGTSATIQLTDKKYIEPQPFCPAYTAAIPGAYNPEIQIYRGYWMLTWFINEFCREERLAAEKEGICTEEYLNRFLKDIPAGSDGLFISPYWTPGVATPSARGSMVGFTDRQSKYHIYKAIIEGVNFELIWGKKMLEKQSKHPINELFVGGGGSASPEILQITADMFGVPVKVIQTPEASGLGSSMIGFVSIGEFRDYEEASASMIHIKKIYTPDPKQHRIYSELYGIYSRLYGNLKKTYKKERLVFRKLKLL